MTPADPKSPRATTSRPFRWLTGILTGVLLAMLVIGTALWAFTGFGLFEFGRMLRGGQVHISLDQPTVIHQIRALQRLEQSATPWTGLSAASARIPSCREYSRAIKFLSRGFYRRVMRCHHYPGSNLQFICRLRSRIT